MAQKRILIVDDDAKILKGLSGFLARNGFVVYTASSGAEALADYKAIEPDMIILDIMMPEMDGFETCRKIREHSDVPVIFLSARNEISDKILGFTFGSDDYITKPFDNGELLFRVNAVLRRLGSNKGKNEDILVLREIKINKTTRIVEVRGERVNLTPKEFSLLWLLASQPERVWTREQLLLHIWNTDYYEDIGLVNTLVKRLREKIEPNPINPSYIITVRGVGYRFEKESFN